MKKVLFLILIILSIVGCSDPATTTTPSKEEVAMVQMGDVPKEIVNGSVITHEVPQSLLDRCENGVIKTESGREIGCPTEVAIHQAPEMTANPPKLSKKELTTISRETLAVYRSTVKHAVVVQWEYYNGNWDIKKKCLGTFVSPHVLRTRADCVWIEGRSPSKTWADANWIYTDENGDGVVETYNSITNRYVGTGWVNRWSNCWNDNNDTCSPMENYAFITLTSSHAYYNQKFNKYNASSPWRMRSFKQSTDEIHNNNIGYQTVNSYMWLNETCGYPNEPHGAHMTDVNIDSREFNDSNAFIDQNWYLIGHTVWRATSPPFADGMLVRDCGDWSSSDTTLDGDDIEEVFEYAKSVAGD